MIEERSFPDLSKDALRRDLWLFRLPSGEYLRPREINAIRITERADRATGQIGARVVVGTAVGANQSWYSIVDMPDAKAAHAFADAMAAYVNWVCMPDEDGKTQVMSKVQLRGLLGDLARDLDAEDPDGS